MWLRMRGSRYVGKGPWPSLRRRGYTLEPAPYWHLTMVHYRDCRPRHLHDIGLISPRDGMAV